ncbi:TPA: sodium/proton antiporter NhaB [Citrobacter freundii]|nr:sodium/proton antiporter NhaB [Citrobacter freundii]
MEIAKGSGSFFDNFLGQSPNWYKKTLFCFLLINPVLFFYASPFLSGWALVIEFIFTLAMALNCYPLLPGGLLAIEAVAMGMTSASHISKELVANLEVLLLLVFMVAGIHFMKQLLLMVFTRLLLGIRSKIVLSLSFCLASAFLSAFLDALTVVAVVISVATGFYGVLHRAGSATHHGMSHDEYHQTLEAFRAFLRSLMMHAAIGTALGGVMTMVGEPQNLIIARVSDWHFGEFFLRIAPVSIPVLICGLVTCVLLEKFRVFGYGEPLPDCVRVLLQEEDTRSRSQMTRSDRMKLIVQGGTAIWLIVALGLHLAEVGLIGLSVIIIITSFCGVTDEHTIGKAFTEALPFTALLTVFFAVVAVIVDQKLFSPVIALVFDAPAQSQMFWFYLCNGFLSSVSDNVFVGTVFINEISQALREGVISLKQYELLAVAVNVGTNLPSVATPNGQAAFLFLLTSSLAPLIRLSWGKMFMMALPWTCVLIITGLLCIEFLLEPATVWMYGTGLLE